MNRNPGQDTSGYHNTAQVILQGSNASQDRQLQARQMLADISQNGIENTLKHHELELQAKNSQQQYAIQMQNLSNSMQELAHRVSEGKANRALESQRLQQLEAQGIREVQSREKIAADNQDVTMRGQDINASTSKAAQQLTMRGQDLGVANAEAQRATTVRGQDINAEIAKASQNQSAAQFAANMIESQYQFDEGQAMRGRELQATKDRNNTLDEQWSQELDLRRREVNARVQGYNAENRNLLLQSVDAEGVPNPRVFALAQQAGVLPEAQQLAEVAFMESLSTSTTQKELEKRLEERKQYLSPEFVNRINEMVTFTEKPNIIRGILNGALDAPWFDSTRNVVSEESLQNLRGNQ